MAAEIVFGPAMLALTELQRRFVLAMASDPLGSAADWAREAGYSDIKDGAKVRAHHLLKNPAVEAAVLEVGKQMLATVGPVLAAHGLIRMASNPKHKNHARAVEMLANRVGLHEVQEVHVHRTDQTGEAMIGRIKELAGRLGLDADKLIGGNAPGALIEAKAVEVKDEIPDGATAETGR